MKITLGNLLRLGTVVLVVSTIGIAGCKSSGDRTTGQVVSDRQVAGGVKKALNKDTIFKYPNVKANVYEGNVQLTGFVETAEQRLRAAEIAARTRGANQIINDILIKPMASGPAAIRDSLGHDASRVMVDTNVPVTRLRNLPATESASQPSGQGGTTTSRPEPQHQ